MINDEFYIISTNSYIKSVSHYLDTDFLKELKTSDGNLKDHVSNLDTNAIYYGRNCIKCTIPTLFIEIEYKSSDKDTYLITHEVFLYEEDYPTLKDLEDYKNKFTFNFASQVEPEVYEIVESFHLGYGCECLSSGDY